MYIYRSSLIEAVCGISAAAQSPARGIQAVTGIPVATLCSPGGCSAGYESYVYVHL